MKEFESEVAVRFRALEIVIEHLGAVLYARAQLPLPAIEALHAALVEASGSPIEKVNPASSDHWSKEVQDQVAALLAGIRDHRLKGGGQAE
jgi:hypothetical protein